ncbi:MAG: hypothetical protein M1460_01305 [Candidatus Thermoplasmatota archaeon]|jgi:hypothetical protein|nr:hypothetical protein [Candidatus Thermoplasmatota archaeon]MCL5987362.1 hypothetical protein [Candidatus Thermoplasmatota archaeon]
MPIKFTKSESDRRYETKTKIRGYRNQVDRSLRNQRQLLSKAIANIRKADSIKDRKGMMNAAQNAMRVKASIDYLQNFSLYLDNLEVTFEFIYNERESNKILGTAHKDLLKNMLTDEQAQQIQKNIDSINEKTELLEERLTEHMSSIDESLKGIADRHEEGVEDIIGDVVSKPAQKTSVSSDDASDVDNLISKILGGEEKS